MPGKQAAQQLDTDINNNTEKYKSDQYGIKLSKDLFNHLKNNNQIKTEKRYYLGIKAIGLEFETYQKYVVSVDCTLSEYDYKLGIPFTFV